VRRKLEEVCWRRSHAHCRRRCWRRGHAPSTQTEPQLEPATPRALFCLKLDNSCVMLATVVTTTATLSSNSCKSASFFMHFTFVLRKQFAMNDTFLREANSYKRALALRNSRQVYLERWSLKQCASMSSPNLVTASGKISRKRQKTAC